MDTPLPLWLPFQFDRALTKRPIETGGHRDWTDICAQSITTPRTMPNNDFPAGVALRGYSGVIVTEHGRHIAVPGSPHIVR